LNRSLKKISDVYILDIIPYQNYVNHIQYHPGQEATRTVFRLTISS